MKKPGYYQEKAAKYQNGALACFLAIISLSGMLGFALKGRDALAVVSSGVFLLGLVVGGLFLAAWGQRYSKRAVLEEIYQAREKQPEVERKYREDLAMERLYEELAEREPWHGQGITLPVEKRRKPEERDRGYLAFYPRDWRTAARRNNYDKPSN